MCCRCSASDVTLAVSNLENLKILRILGVDLAVAGAAAGAGGVLEIASGSLSTLELMESKASALTLFHAPSLERLLAGVVSPEVKNPRVMWPSMEKATPAVRRWLLWPRCWPPLPTSSASVSTRTRAWLTPPSHTTGTWTTRASLLPRASTGTSRQTWLLLDLIGSPIQGADKKCSSFL